MVIHTIIDPAEMAEAAPYQGQYRQITGGILQGRLADGDFVVDRLIATDPKMFLDPKYTPGAVYKI